MEIAWGSTGIALFGNGFWMDPFTGLLISNFVARVRIIPEPTIYHPIIIKTTNGTIFVDMMDRNWVSRALMFPLSTGTDQIVDFREVVAIGLYSTVAMVSQISEAISQGGNWENLRRNFPDEVTLYMNFEVQEEEDQPFAYLGVDETFYDAKDGLPMQGHFTQIGLVLLDPTLSLYHIQETGDDIAIQVNQLGQSFSYLDYPAETVTQILAWNLLRLPRSLIPENERLSMFPAVPNYILEHRLEHLRELNAGMDSYPGFDTVSRFYLVYGEKSVPFSWNSTRNSFVNLNGVDISLPNHPLVEIYLGNVPLVEQLLYELESNQIVSIGKTQNGEVNIIDRVSIGPPTERNAIRTVYPIFGTDDKLLREIQRRIQNGESDANLGAPSWGGVINQQVLEALITQMYGCDLTEPNILNGYTRVDFSELSQLVREHHVRDMAASTLLQPFAGPPGTPNSIIVLTTSSGHKLFGKVRLDEQGNLLPPA